MKKQWIIVLLGSFCMTLNAQQDRQENTEQTDVDSISLGYGLYREVKMAPASAAVIEKKAFANSPLGLEAWAEYRRTGYPELFPCIDNLSSVVTDKVRGMRRLRYPYTEAQNNSQNYQNGVALLGGGPDDETTDLVFGKKN